MGKLTEYVQAEAGRLKAEFDKQVEALEEWEAAVTRLYDQLEMWLRDADGGHGLLRTGRERSSIVHDPSLGTYRAETLAIALGERAAELVPRARYVGAAIRPPGREPRRADGRVDLRDGSTAHAYLFRLRNPSGDEWFIRAVWLWNSDSEFGTVEPLDRDRFEAALLGVLK
jgi:hypothetical protein